MGKYKEIIICVVILLYVITTINITSEEYKKEICSNLHINIVDSNQNRFINQKDIKNIISKNHKQIYGAKLINVNTEQLEQKISQNQLIKNVELYKSINGTLNITVTLKNTLIRIIPIKGNSYYLDSEGKIMPLSDKYTARTIIANGFITEQFAVKELFELAKYISEHKFWKAQIEQIYVNNKKELELLPKVGDHIVYFGKTKGYKEKFERLFALYKYGFNKYGWNKYKSINLKYNNQIVCTKK